MARESNQLEKYQQLDPRLRDLLESCLSISSKERPLPKQILDHALFVNDREKYLYRKPKMPETPLLRFPLKQIYYWWQLAGGDIHSELKSNGLIRNEAPILSMPKYIYFHSIFSKQNQNTKIYFRL